MLNTLNINYIIFANMNDSGEETEMHYALHICNDLNETMIEHSNSFEELKNKVSIGDLINVIKNLEDEHYHYSIQVNNGLKFNGQWYTLEELKKTKLVKQCRSFFVPGHGPDFESMTINELKKWHSIINKTFEDAFSEEEYFDEEVI